MSLENIGNVHTDLIPLSVLQDTRQGTQKSSDTK